MAEWVVVITFALVVPFSHGLLEPMPLPKSLWQCYEYKSFQINNTQLPARKIQDYCIRKYLYENAEHMWAPPNITEDGVNYINSLMRQIFSEIHDIKLYDLDQKKGNGTKTRRRKRQAAPGMRYRKELRTLQPKEWIRFTQCLNRLKSIVCITWDIRLM